MSLALLAGKLLTVALGFIIAAKGFQGYRRHQSEPMFYLSSGFLFISVGGVMDCSFFTLLDIETLMSGVIQTSLVAIGMVLVLYSMYR
ncbi:MULTISPECIES: hypothetical protein [unclassified Haladaptatus]|uniref:DUF7521 family protein n=1 Tax=unclassified Haladaptatus TaxID=2622732 RepID=UPI0023E8B847|nr:MULTISPECIES: hypothetical protein [unclassified Haladaptatus]